MYQIEKRQCGRDRYRERQKNHVFCVIRGHFQVVGPAVERRIAARWIAMIGIMKRGRLSCRVSRRVSRES